MSQAPKAPFVHACKGEDHAQLHPLNNSLARFDAVAAAEKHLRRHGAALCDLLDALSERFPDAHAVEQALCDIRRILSAQAPSALDRISHERNLPASDMARWHGARVSDLLARFRHAGWARYAAPGGNGATVLPKKFGETADFFF